MTVFIAATGFLLNAVLADRAIGLPRGIDPALKGVGIVLAVLFGIMEYSAKEYWKDYAQRAQAIEKCLSGFQLITAVESTPGQRLGYTYG